MSGVSVGFNAKYDGRCVSARDRIASRINRAGPISICGVGVLKRRLRREWDERDRASLTSIHKGHRLSHQLEVGHRCFSIR